MSDPRQMAIELLKENRDEIAKRVVQQSAKTAPGMKIIDRDARIASIRGLIDAARQCLITHDDDLVLKQIHGLSELRKTAGVDIRSLAASSHCYLPVIRRVFMARASSPMTGYAAFEAIEGEILEIVVSGLINAFPNDLDPAAFIAIGDDDDDATDPQRPRFNFLPFSEL